MPDGNGKKRPAKMFHRKSRNGCQRCRARRVKVCHLGVGCSSKVQADLFEVSRLPCLISMFVKYGDFLATTVYDLKRKSIRISYNATDNFESD